MCLHRGPSALDASPCFLIQTCGKPRDDNNLARSSTGAWLCRARLAAVEHPSVMFPPFLYRSKPHKRHSDSDRTVNAAMHPWARRSQPRSVFETVATTFSRRTAAPRATGGHTNRSPMRKEGHTEAPHWDHLFHNAVLRGTEVLWRRRMHKEQHAWCQARALIL